MSELLIARNPSEDSTLRLLIRLPLDGGTVFRTSDSWPRTKALYCHPVPAAEWPDDTEIVERVPLRSCVRRGAAIDLIADRGRESRSQIVYTKARGRDMVFWQAPRTRKQARPNVRLPTARAAGIADLQILVDSHERYAYSFSGQQVTTSKRALPCGDYAVEADGLLFASVERKSLEDLSSSMTNGRLRFALAELAALPRAAVVVEDRYSALLKSTFVRPAVLADGLAELQMRYPNVPIVFCETRSLAQEWTYRFLAAAAAWAATETGMRLRVQGPAAHLRAADPPAADPRVADPRVADAPAADAPGPSTPGPETAEVRAWARTAGIEVPDRGRLRPSVWAAWHVAHRPDR